MDCCYWCYRVGSTGACARALLNRLEKGVQKNVTNTLWYTKLLLNNYINNYYFI